ncbi:hypothetical protein AB205_0121670, partial [Aquarana catesbeiana]
DEVSIVVSQRSKAAAVDHTEQEGTFETKQSSLVIQVNVFTKKKDLNELPKFEKNFYQEHSEVERMTIHDVDQLRRKKEITTRGVNCPKPIYDFHQTNFPLCVMDALLDQRFKEPTPIQCQGFPPALSGRDMVGIA